MKTFKEYIDAKNPNKDVDDEIMKNPKLLMKPGVDPKKDQEKIRKIFDMKRRNNVGLDVAARAVSIQSK